MKICVAGFSTNPNKEAKATARHESEHATVVMASSTIREAESLATAQTFRNNTSHGIQELKQTFAHKVHAGRRLFFEIRPSDVHKEVQGVKHKLRSET